MMNWIENNFGRTIVLVFSLAIIGAILIVREEMKQEDQWIMANPLGGACKESCAPNEFSFNQTSHECLCYSKRSGQYFPVFLPTILPMR
jgi:hypothetical protein